MKLDIKITKKQRDFINSTEDEVLFGGAAGGGKSYGQIIDALLYALKYPKSKQLILRRSFAELDKSIIRAALDVYPILKLFDGLVVSGPIHMVKPNADIFLHTLEKFGLKADESLFVDDMAVNAEGARKVGMYGYAYSGDADELLKYIEALS